MNYQYLGSLSQQGAFPTPDSANILRGAQLHSVKIAAGGSLLTASALNRYNLKNQGGMIMPIDMPKFLGDCNFTPDNLMDRVWISRASIPASGEFDSEYIGYAAHWLEVPVYSKDEYFQLLLEEQDPRRFVQYLTRWPAFGLRLSPQMFGISNHNLTDIDIDGIRYRSQSGMIADSAINIVPADPSDIEKYRYAIAQFYEKTLVGFIKDALMARQLLSSYDENTILAAFSAVSNSLRSSRSFISERPQLTVEYNGRSAYTTMSFLPLLNVPFSGKSYRVKEALEAQYDYASFVLRAAEEILGAHALSLSDKRNALRLSPYANDPAFNLFLIWAGEDKDGATIYQDVAVNATPGNIQRQAQKIAVTYGPTSAHFEAVPLLRQYVARSASQPSAWDIDRTTAKKSGIGTMLFIAGGIAAAAVASRYA